MARYGDEEFVVALSGAPLVHTTVIVERIQQKIHNAVLPHKASAVAAVVAVSTDVVTPDGTVPMETLIARADSVSYQTKSKGRN